MESLADKSEEKQQAAGMMTGHIDWKFFGEEDDSREEKKTEPSKVWEGTP